ncbi:MAG TPA: F0F1 ATP synthase subunit A [Longimicrobium sp.]|jgi:F-type H+-transporting ATPase subunit a|uniref:F0F1 ATP synthase subunit A n=1 Tax=Longimicrobium sp. TaxID=2029185 RepID=UPI002ED8BBE0
MISTIAVLLALAGAPQQADPVHAPPPQGDPYGTADTHAPAAAPSGQGAVETMGGTQDHGADPNAGHAPAAAGEHGAAAEEGHGGGGQIDFLHHIQDSREWELPGTVLHFPAAGSWMVGPIDMTPTKHVLFLGFAALLTLLTLLGGAGLAARAGAGRTGGKRHNLIEAMVLYVRNEVVMPNVGHGGEKYAPFIVTLFFFILFNNLLGLIPYGSTPTAGISVTIGLAFLVFLVVEVGGMMAVGPRQYWHTIWFVPKGMNPIAGNLMAAALMPIELSGKFVRPIALAIRLMANMTAGHIVLLAIISLIFVFGSWAVLPAPVLMAVAITFLELFVAFLQAFIFAMLASVFIGLVRHAH